MDNEQFQQRNRKVTRQSWKPAKPVAFAHGVWKSIYSIVKIALGAVATVVVIAGVCAFVFVGLLAGYLEGEILPTAGVQLEGFDLNEPSYVYSVDENGDIHVLQRLHADTENDWVAYEDIPKYLIDAAVSIEDHRFWEHQGVDWFTTIKAGVNMFVGSGSQFGGSSITQQLIKNLMLPEDEGADDVTVQRKVLEIFRATAFERRYDKTVILEWYLNKIYLGNRCEGVKAAAAKYFGKELEFLTPAECACLISITNNPSLFNPYRDNLDSKGLTGMQQNEIRRTNTLFMMKEYGYLTEEEYQDALAQEIVLKDGIDFEDRVFDCEEEGCGYHGKVTTFLYKEDGRYYCPQCSHVTGIGYDATQEVYSYFVDTVIEDVAERLASDAGLEFTDEIKAHYKQLISNGGYHIYSTLNRDVQAQVDKIYTNLDEIPPTASVQQLNSAIVVIDNETGDIIAMAGGVGEKDTHDGWNIATDSRLQPGSSLKPLAVYGPAFEINLITPASVLRDMPIEYYPIPNATPLPDGTLPVSAFPKNDTKVYGYSYNVQRAVRSSINACAVNLLSTMGLEYSFNFAKYNFGLSDLVEKYVNSNGTVLSDIGMSPLGLGAPTVGVSVRQMSAAYATFANNGVYREARTYTHVYNTSGELVLYNQQDSRTILSEKTVNYMNFCMDYAVEIGTGRFADIPGQHVAGKTGTTSSEKDRWFCGFTDYYTAAVWCGYSKTPEPIVQTGSNTGNAACQLFKKVMTPLHKDKAAVPVCDTSKLVQVSMCLDSGKLATDACAHDVRGSRVVTGYCETVDIPTETCDKHIVVDICASGNGYANQYCKNLAQAGQLSFTQTALVKMTKVDVEALEAARKHGLDAAFLSDDYIYLVDGEGNPQSFFGLQGNINYGMNEPYKACTVHTQQMWQQYLASHPQAQTPSTDATTSS